MDKQVIILIMVVALVALVGVQAVQINDLKSDIADGEISVTGAAVRTQSSTPTRAVTTRSAPTMVGGC